MAMRKWMKVPSSNEDGYVAVKRYGDNVVGYIRKRATSGYEWLLGCREGPLTARGVAVTVAIAKKRADAAHKSKCGG
jgi:hypothetical protein